MPNVRTQPGRIPWNVVHEISIGPFAGGINRYSDESAINDMEMVDCVNFDIDLDGSLKSRPPWRLMTTNSITTVTTGTSTVPANFQLFLGSFTYGGIRRVYFNDATNGAWVYFVDGPNAGTFTFLFSGKYSKAIRYNDFVYLIPDVTNADDKGLKIYLDGSLSPQQVNLKRGYSATIYKDRLWITGRRGLAPESRLFFSDPGAPETFQSTSFFDINPGDGDATQDLTVYQDNLVIFKDSATYVLTFDTNPAQAALQVINTDIGVNGPRCVIPYENSVFLLQYNQVYEMVNYDFTRVSVKVPFEYDTTLPDPTSGYAWQDPIWMSRIGDRLVARFYNRLYVYHLRLRAWARWDSDDLNIRYLGYIGLIDNTIASLRNGVNSYVSFSALNGQYDVANNPTAGKWVTGPKMFVLDDQYESTYVENGNLVSSPLLIKCLMKTKAFDFGVSPRYKRLMHWGVDLITGQEVIGLATPTAQAFQSSWDELTSIQWHNLGEWQSPSFANESTSVLGVVGQMLRRRYVRFGNSFRFRIVQFKMEMFASGNTSDGPARLYNITVFMSGKQTVPNEVN